MSTPLLGIVERVQLRTKSQMHLFCVPSGGACEHGYLATCSLRRKISWVGEKTYKHEPWRSGLGDLGYTVGTLSFVDFNRTAFTPSGDCTRTNPSDPFDP